MIVAVPGANGRPAMAPDHGTLAERLYEAYGEDAGWRNYQGFRMPSWDELPSETRDHWTAVARKAAEMLL